MSWLYCGGKVLTFGAWDRVPHVRETKTNMLSLYMEISATRGKQVIGESRRQAYGPSRGVQKVDFLYRDLNSECFHRQGQWILPLMWLQTVGAIVSCRNYGSTQLFHGKTNHDSRLISSSKDMHQNFTKVTLVSLKTQQGCIHISNMRCKVLLAVPFKYISNPTKQKAYMN